MKTRIETAGTERGSLAADLKRGGHPPSGAPVRVLPPLVIALERWVNEGGSGDDPDGTARLDQARTVPRRKNP